MTEFSYFLPANILFGIGRVSETGLHAKRFGKKALIVTGASSAKKSGLYDKVRKSLEAEGIATVLFDKVQQNPLTTTAEEGAALASSEKCDVVVAAGGGSIIDCAKGIAFLAVNDGDINDYIFGRRESGNALPVIAIPTTCGTGSEGNGFAVLTNPENGDKKSLRCPAILPKVSIVDPSCMMTMPPSVLSSVGFDALCHCIESYTAKKSQPFCDALSSRAISLLAEHLPALYGKIKEGAAATDESLLESWEAVSLASTIGGMSIGICGVTLSHGMEHPASGLRNIVHGRGLSALTPSVTDFTVRKLAEERGKNPAKEKFARVSHLLGGGGILDCAQKIREFIESLDLPENLGALGIEKADIPWMTENCLKVSAGNLANMCVDVKKDDIARIYEEAVG